MAFDIFTKDEIRIAVEFVKIGIFILVGTAVVSGVLQVTSTYVSDSQVGVVSNLKQELDAKIQNTEKPVANFVELPLYLEVPSIGVKTKIESPDTTNVDVLDNALSRAVVYYQGSGTPGNRNMLIFGHSTGFSIVRNPVYKVFNNIKLAKKGEYAYVHTATGIHTYKIISVKKMSKYDTYIQFNSKNPMLTLSTCDSFGKASDRWVLEADYVGFKGK